MGNRTKDKTKIILIMIVILLAGFIIFMFVVKPILTRYNLKMQNQGVQYAIWLIMQQAATCQPVPLTFENQTINIIAIDCLRNESQD
jgi:beta-lactamase regulating signal transducer with metallopeptidase domain